MNSRSSSDGRAPGHDSAHRHWSWRPWVALALLAAALALLAVCPIRDQRDLSSVPIGKPWPAMSLPLLEEMTCGHMLTDPEQLRGKAYAVNLWASWCRACRAEHPVLLALADTLREQGRAEQLIGLNYKDKTANATTWLAQFGNPYAATFVDANGQFATELGVHGAPRTFVVDTQGRIAWKHAGALTPELVAQEILPRLLESAP